MSWRILYVDDEPDLREVAQISLELDPELVVRCSASGAEAIEALPDWRPDLVLLDVMMPEMDGPATLERIRQSPGGGPPVVFITARAGDNDAARLMALGAAGVIGKPFDPLQLAVQVRRYLES
ncbi:response regulator [Croceibacterium sp. LX-88]|jgi:CheY-like chemotaxis protein|uniref:Response regulator n=1 Tax=Croceibacterium selenioxidans TaxID=2838833 RepID=A0ABS5W0N1_9SPHN|nr:response regulator [Croceibacterium selenioxidans]MBT2133021.1 response regulator [Croceibacterium selenioxidans]